MLRDRLVCGINHDCIQRRLLSEVTLTFDTALQLAQAIKSADKDVQDLKPLKVHKFKYESELMIVMRK